MAKLISSTFTLMDKCQRLSTALSHRTCQVHTRQEIISRSNIPATPSSQPWNKAIRFPFGPSMPTPANSMILWSSSSTFQSQRQKEGTSGSMKWVIWLEYDSGLILFERMSWEEVSPFENILSMISWYPFTSQTIIKTNDIFGVFAWYFHRINHQKEPILYFLLLLYTKQSPTYYLSYLLKKTSPKSTHTHFTLTIPNLPSLPIPKIRYLDWLI